MKLKIRDPISGLTHLAGAVLGVVALVYLVSRSLTLGSTRHVVAFAIYGTSLILLYASSAFYHLLEISDSARLVLRRIDHTMIFFLIAGSYTPYCMLALHSRWASIFFATVWILTFVGVLQSVLWIHAPRWLTTGLYLLIGWMATLLIYPLSQALSPAGLYFLVAGGLLYTVGAVIYAAKWPDPFPKTFGFHEIWHLFVLAGSAGHFLSVRTLL